MKLDPPELELILRYKEMVLGFIALPGADIDPDDSLCWRSLSIGYFLARGAPIAEAHDLARIVRYDEREVRAALA